MRKLASTGFQTWFKCWALPWDHGTYHLSICVMERQIGTAVLNPQFVCSACVCVDRLENSRHWRDDSVSSTNNEKITRTFLFFSFREESNPTPFALFLVNVCSACTWSESGYGIFLSTTSWKMVKTTIIQISTKPLLIISDFLACLWQSTG